MLDAEYAVVVEHLVKRFGDTVAVADVSFQVRRGEFIALIGSSGCGKTTTLRILAGLERPTSGRILVEGRDVTEMPPHKRTARLVWQNFALFPHMDVRGNVEYGLRVTGVGKKERAARIQRVFDLLTIGELAGRRIQELSGGQQQRVGLARALVTDPSVLLLDEPLGSLDARLRMTMQGSLKSLQRQLGTTFVYVTHNQSEAFAMADTVAVMNRGAIEQIGEPADVFRHPATKFIAEFVGTNNVFDGRLERTNGSYCLVETPVGKLRTPFGAAAPPPVGHGVSVVVPADAVTLHQETEIGTARDHVRGHVIGEQYFGTLLEIIIRPDNAAAVMRALVSLREQGDHGVHVGDRVVASWSPEDAFHITSRKA